MTPLSRDENYSSSLRAALLFPLLILLSTSVDSQTLETAWTRDFGHPVTVVATSDQSILVAGSAFSQSLAAFNTADGQKLWQTWISSAPWGNPLSFGHQTYLNPHNGGAVALKLETGKQLWRLPRNSGAAQAPPVRVKKELLLRVSLDGRVTLFNRQGATQKSLRLRLEPRDRCPYPPAQVEERIYLGTRNGTIWELPLDKLQASRQRKLKIPGREFPSATQLVGPLVAGESTLFALTLEGSLLRLNLDYVENATIDWLVNVWPADHLYGSSGAILAPPLLDETALYLAGSQAAIAIEQQSGKQRWRHRFPSSQNPALSPDGHGLALVSDSALRLINPQTGTLIAETPLSTPPASPPIWQHDFVVLGFENGEIRAYRLTPESPPTSSSP